MTKRERNRIYKDIYRKYSGEEMEYVNKFMCDNFHTYTCRNNETTLFKTFPELKQMFPSNWEPYDVLNIEKKYWKERKGKTVSTKRVNALRACMLEFCIEMTN